jgi:hypothetical protein
MRELEAEAKDVCHCQERAEELRIEAVDERKLRTGIRWSSWFDNTCWTPLGQLVADVVIQLSSCKRVSVYNINLDAETRVVGCQDIEIGQ